MSQVRRLLERPCGRIIWAWCAYITVHAVLLFVLYFTPLGWNESGQPSEILHGVLAALRVLDFPTRAVSDVFSARWLVWMDAGGLPWSPAVNTLGAALCLCACRLVGRVGRDGPHSAGS
jgi:hypothetical protein